MAHIKFGYKDDLVSRKELYEIMMRHRPLWGSDESKERYAYIEWLGIYHAIREMPFAKYDSFCDVPMAEAAEVMRMYKNGELVHLKGREPQEAWKEPFETDCPWK